MKKRRTFTSGASEFLAGLKEKGIAYQEFYQQEYCQECEGAGMGCICDDGLVDVLIVEYEEGDGQQAH